MTATYENKSLCLIMLSYGYDTKIREKCFTIAAFMPLLEESHPADDACLPTRRTSTGRVRLEGEDLCDWWCIRSGIPPSMESFALGVALSDISRLSAK